MRVSPPEASATDALLSAGTLAERTLQATQLLRQALALLGADSTLEVSPVRRHHDRLLRMPEVERLTGLRRSAIYERMQCGAFPRSAKAGVRAARWSEAAVQRWIAERLEGNEQR